MQPFSPVTDVEFVIKETVGSTIGNHQVSPFIMSTLGVRKACQADLNTLEHNEARRLRRANKPVAPSTTTSSSTTSELMLCGQVSTPPAVIGGRRAWPASTPASGQPSAFAFSEVDRHVSNLIVIVAIEEEENRVNKDSEGDNDIAEFGKPGECKAEYDIRISACKFIIQSDRDSKQAAWEGEAAVSPRSIYCQTSTENRVTIIFPQTRAHIDFE